MFDESRFRAIVADVVRQVLREESGRRPDEFVSVRDASSMAAVSPQTIRAWIKDGKLGRYSAGRHLRIRWSELETLLATLPDECDVSPEAAAVEAIRRRKSA